MRNLPTVNQERSERVQALRDHDELTYEVFFLGTRETLRIPVKEVGLDYDGGATNFELTLWDDVDLSQVDGDEFVLMRIGERQHLDVVHGEACGIFVESKGYDWPMARLSARKGVQRYRLSALGTGETLAELYYGFLEDLQPELTDPAKLVDSLAWAWAVSESTDQRKQEALERVKVLEAIKAEIDALAPTQLEREALAKHLKVRPFTLQDFILFSRSKDMLN